MTPIYGSAFSIEVLSRQPLPVVPKHLLPWLLKDRREATTGSYYRTNEGKQEHDRMGLDYALKELKRIERDLAEASGNRAAILSIQRNQQAAAVEFWEGKIWLLDRVIAATQAAP